MQRRSGVGGDLWLGDVKRVVRTNLPAMSDTVALITVTGPGADVLPWSDTERGMVDQASRDAWNATAQQRWSEMHRKAAQNATRQTGEKSKLIARVWQMQARGVLHVHLAASFWTIPEQRWVKAYVAELRRIRTKHGFGYVDFRDRSGKAGQPSVMAAEKAAGYLTHYLTTSEQFSDVLRSAVRPRRPVYVSNRALAITKCTMRNLRRVRFLYWLRRGESRVFAEAGKLPRWFIDHSQRDPVYALARAP
jgi:hypothetical protein